MIKVLDNKIDLANLPTPLQKVEYKKKKFLVKRDDHTGVETTGNKIRKLEYLLFDARKQKADVIFTSGGDQSNHARATVFAAMAQGFKVRLFLWGSESKNPTGNLFFDEFMGADITYLNKKDYMNVNDIMEQEKEKYKKKGKKAYVIPSGGSSPVGVLGYINFLRELSAQTEIGKIRGILSATGSGGTAAGLLLGSQLLNMNLKIFGVPVIEPAEEMKKHILDLVDDTNKKMKFDVKIDPSRLELFDGYSDEGYKNIDQKKVRLLRDFARSSSIILDPAYTGKAFNAYYDSFIKPGGNHKVLFLHTGGIYGVFAKSRQYLE